MKHPPFTLLLLTLICTVLWAQQPADSTVFFKIDQLVEQEKLSQIPALIRQHSASQTACWDYFYEKTKARAKHFFELKNFENSIRLLDSSLNFLSQNKRADSLGTARLWVWKALSHRMLEQYSDALDAYSKALRIYESNRFNGPIVAYAYNNAAQICIRRQNYSQANAFLKAGLQSDSTGSEQLSIYSQLANNAYWQDSLELASRYIEFGKKLPGGGSARAALESVEADLLIKKGRFQEAAPLVREILQYYQTDPDEGENRLRCYATLATVAAGMNQPAQAIAHYRQAEALGLNWFKGKSRELAKLYTEWGDFLAQQGQPQQALLLYQKAIIQAFPDFNNPDPEINPPPGNVPLELWAIFAPARKAALLLQNPGPEQRRSAADCFDLAFAAVDRLRRTYGTDEAKLYLVQHNYNLHRESVLNLWELYQQSSDAQILKRLFDLLENNRANTLRDALQQQRALALSGVPDALLNIEEQKRLDIADLQKDIGQKQSAGENNKAASLTRELSRRQLLYDEMLGELKENYSQFREFLSAGQTAALPAIRAALPDKTALLSWFDAGNRYLCIALRKQGLSAFEVPRNSDLDQTLLRFQTQLADKNSQETKPAAFFADAWFLKQALLPDSILSSTDALILIPDGRLAYLPFEVLLSKPHAGAYSTAPYLLRSHRAQYVWSATLLTDTLVAKAAQHSLLHVAPFVEKNRDGLALLPNSLRERPENISAKLLKGPAALAGQFLSEAADYDVLHLSTHAHAGQRSQPGIEFFDRTVLLPEIYAQRLRASLVALSACETGGGDFAEGEGVLSLARAFAYAGAQSLVASHWSVNDRSTADLFAAFYQQLEKGLGKSEALRQAKLQMLAQAGPDARKAPFYWAAFTLSGADGPVDLPENGWPWWVWGFIGIGILLTVWRLFKRSRAM